MGRLTLVPKCDIEITHAKQPKFLGVAPPCEGDASSPERSHRTWPRRGIAELRTSSPEWHLELDVLNAPGTAAMAPAFDGPRTHRKGKKKLISEGPPKGGEAKACVEGNAPASPMTKCWERECCICMERSDCRSGLTCGDPDKGPGGVAGGVADGGEAGAETHFICAANGCVSDYIRAQSTAEPRRLLVHKGQLPCPIANCSSPPYAHSVVAKAVPGDVFELYMQQFRRTTEHLLQNEFDQRMEAEQKRAEDARDQAHDGQENAVQEHRRHVMEWILTDHCPRCSAAFLDFDGCFALKCARCDAGFCAYCLRDCGGDAHPHIKVCTLKGPGNGTWGTVEVFHKIQRQRHEAALQAYVATIQPLAVQARVITSLQKELNERKLQLAAPIPPVVMCCAIS